MVLRAGGKCSDRVSPQEHAKSIACASWGRRATVYAFWFFLLKGLAWLAVPVVAACYAGV